jgi:hypothetical protein
MFVTLKLLETSLESVPLAMLMVANRHLTRTLSPNPEPSPQPKPDPNLTLIPEQVAAIVTGGSAGSMGSMLLWASLSITCLSMSYGLFLQATLTPTPTQTLTLTQPKP